MPETIGTLTRRIKQIRARLEKYTLFQKDMTHAVRELDDSIDVLLQGYNDVSEAVKRNTQDIEALAGSIINLQKAYDDIPKPTVNPIGFNAQEKLANMQSPSDKIKHTK